MEQGSYMTQDREGTQKKCSHLPSPSSCMCLPQLKLLRSQLAKEPEHRGEPPGTQNKQRKAGNRSERQRRTRTLGSSKTLYSGFLGGSVVKNPSAKAGDVGWIPESGRSPGKGNGNPLQLKKNNKNYLTMGLWFLLGHCLLSYCQDVLLKDQHIDEGMAETYFRTLSVLTIIQR